MITEPQTVWTADPTAAHTLGIPHVGGKAASLAALSADGHRVPPFVVVTTGACRAVLEPVAAEIDRVVGALDADSPVAVRAASERIRRLVTGLDLPGAMRTEISAAIVDITGGEPAARLAVRSSVRGEDSATDSFAGQLDSVLGVHPDRVTEAILQCLASAWTDRALFYRARRGLDVRVEAAVVVQLQVDSVVAGVAFSCNPRNGDRSEAVVSAAPGLGEGVVSGTVDCDTWFVDAATGVIGDRSITAGSSRVVAEGDYGTTIVETPTDHLEAPAACLTDEQVRRIAETAVRLASVAGVPQDVEWALDPAGELVLLQARPVTAMGERETIFDNVNVAESYPGMSSPLTFSFVQRAYEQVFRVCHRDFGATRATVTADMVDLYPYLLASIRGRIYYNISNWYRLFLQIPGLEFAIPGWEAALGIENRWSRPPRRTRGLARVRELFWRVRALVVIVAGWKGLGRRFRAFRRDLDAARTEVDAMLSPDTPAWRRDPATLQAWLDRSMTELAPAYSVQILNDFLAQQLFHVVGLALTRAGVPDADSLRNELFCGEQGVDSVDPVRSALGLAAFARQDRDLAEQLSDPGLPDSAVWDRIASDPRFAAFHSRCLEHIADFGDRTIDELKLETETLDHRPELLIPMVRNYLRAGRSIEDMEATERRIRIEAEKRAATAVQGRPVERLMLAFALRHARETVRWRENMRLGRSRCFGLVKRVYREMATQLVSAGILDDPSDIFYLTYDEIGAFVRGTAVDGDPRRVVAARRAEHAAWADIPPPSRIVASGVPAAQWFVDEEDVAPTGDVLYGTACAPGRVTAPALVLDAPDPTARVDGQVLVASTTDPGWVFLMVASGGLVSERGSVLSHTAIIGRELGIPTVVGVAGARSRVSTGQTVTLDGAAGTLVVREERA